MRDSLKKQIIKEDANYLREYLKRVVNEEKFCLTDNHIDVLIKIKRLKDEIVDK